MYFKKIIIYFVYLLSLLHDDFLKIKSQLHEYQNINYVFLIKRRILYQNEIQQF